MSHLEIFLTYCIHSLFYPPQKGQATLLSFTTHSPKVIGLDRDTEYKGRRLFFLENCEVPILQKFSGLKPWTAPIGLGSFSLSVPPDKQKKTFSVPSVVKMNV